MKLTLKYLKIAKRKAEEDIDCYYNWISGKQKELAHLNKCIEEQLPKYLEAGE